MKTALITGVTGQDGSYLTEYLLSKGYKVFGLQRRTSLFNTERLDHLLSCDLNSPQFAKSFHQNFYLVYGDLTDGGSLSRLLYDIRPDEIYNLGAQSHVRISFDQPEFTMNVNAVGNLRLLDSIRSICKNSRFYQASSSECFGNSECPQDEQTPFCPCSPYGISKVAAFYQTVNYRNSYDMFAVNGILFNHESPRRTENFVTRKITRAATRIKLGLQENLSLGNLDAKRDFGYAKEYVEAMWLMLQYDKPDDYVVATGETHSVKEFLESSFNYLGLDPYKYLKIDQRYFRPTELNTLQGNASKCRKILKWEPKTKFNDLVKIMVDADMILAQKEKEKHDK